MTQVMTQLVGKPAPPFSLPSTEGRAISSDEFVGKQALILVFYPGDDTPGCNKQLCALRDDYSQVTAAGAVVLGINPAGLDSKQAYKQKFQFPFPLLSDETKDVSKAYGALSPEGKVSRTVVVIAKDGTVRWVQPGMPSDDEILSHLR